MKLLELCRHLMGNDTDDSNHMRYEFLNMATVQCSEGCVECQVDAVFGEIGQTHMVAL
jgi:hypothetical protein